MVQKPCLNLTNGYKNICKSCKPATTHAEPAPQRHPPHQPGRRYGPQNRHLRVARPPARTPAQTRHAPPSGRTPSSPQAWEADPGRRPCRKATPERRRNRWTMQPPCPHRQPNRNAGSSRWVRRKCGGPHSKQQHQHQWGNLAMEQTGQQCSMPTRGTWRHTEAARHRLLANLIRNLKDQCRTTVVRTASAHNQPMSCNRQVARAPPPWRTQRITPTQARRGRRRHGTHRKPARRHRPGEPHPTRPSARPAERCRPADTTATTTLSMPSWSPAWVTPTRLQRRRHRASARSNDANMQRTHPSRYHARHTSSAIITPWGTTGMLPLQVTGTRPRAEQRTRPPTSAAPQELGRAWRREATPLASLTAHRRGPPRPEGGDIWTTQAWRATPAAPATKRNRRQPKTCAYGSPGLPQKSSSPWQSASDGCSLRGPATSRRAPAP